MQVDVEYRNFLTWLDDNILIQNLRILDSLWILQGSFLDPFLLVIFINDVFDDLNVSYLLYYADDDIKIFYAQIHKTVFNFKKI